MRILLTAIFVALSLIVSAQGKSILGKYSHSYFMYRYILTLADSGEFVVEEYSDVSTKTTTGTWKIRERLVTLTPKLCMGTFPGGDEEDKREYEMPSKYLEKTLISVDEENNLTILSQEKTFDSIKYKEPDYQLTKIFGGNVKTNLPKEMAKRFAGHPKLIKRQFTSESCNVHCGLQDKKGRLWFGTEGEGVYRYDGKSFTNFTQKDGLNDTFIFSMVEDKKGNIWFATASGLSRYDGKTFTPVALFGNKFVWSIFGDKRGKLWFGTPDGLYVYDGKAFTHFLDNQSIVNSSGLTLHGVQDMLEDKNGNIWFATRDEGVCRYDGKAIINYKPNNEIKFREIFETKDGNIWVGGKGKGVYHYDGKYFNKLSQKEEFDSCVVHSITQDKAGNIWFGTEADDLNEGGAWIYDGVSLKRFSTKNGMISKSVWLVQVDKSGNLWFGTGNTGLCRYDGKTFTNFSE